MNFAALYLFAVGITCPLWFRQFGNLYIGEVLIILGLLVALPTGLKFARATPLFLRYVLLLLAMFAGYALSDIICATPTDKLIRGWARVIFLGLDFLFFASVFLRAKRLLLWFSLGFGLGKILTPRASSAASAFNKELDYITRWKFNYAPGAMNILGAVAPIFSKRPMAIAAVGLGFFILLLGTRALGGVTMLTGILLFFKPKNGGQGIVVMARTVLIGALALGILGGSYSLVKDEIIKKRKYISDEGRFEGLTVAAGFIAQSPIIGYGSWKFTDERQTATSSRTYYRMGSGGHSYVLQSWLEGGILAGMFFIHLFYTCSRALYLVLGPRPYDAMSPIYVLLLFLGLWNILLSPFGGDHRVFIALYMTVTCMIDTERIASKHWTVPL